MHVCLLPALLYVIVAVLLVDLYPVKVEQNGYQTEMLVNGLEEDIVQRMSENRE